MTIVSLTVNAPSADAAGAASTGRGYRLTGVAGCDDGGRIKLVTRLNAAGTEHGKVTVSGVSSTRWTGQLLLNPDALYEQMASDDDATSNAAFETLMNNTKRHVAKHGTFSARATAAGTGTLDASAMFASRSLDMCVVAISAHDGTYDVNGSGSVFGQLSVRTVRKPAVVVTIGGVKNHRYRIALTVRTKAGTQHSSLIRTAGALRTVRASVRGIKGLSSFREASVTITDTSLHPASVEAYTLIR